MKFVQPNNLSSTNRQQAMHVLIVSKCRVLLALAKQMTPRPDVGNIFGFDPCFLASRNAEDGQIRGEVASARIFGCVWYDSCFDSQGILTE